MSVDMAAIRARLEAFRDLPWSWRVTDDRRWAVVEDANGDRRAQVNDDDLAESIAHAPADVAALLDALAAAEAERDAALARLAKVEALAEEWEQADEGYTGEAAYFARKCGGLLRRVLGGEDA